jgi:hypothetical protein
MTQIYPFHLGCRAREALRACLPEPLRDSTFSTLLKVRNHHSKASSLLIVKGAFIGGYGY